MKTTKWIIGGLVAAGALYLVWPKKASAATAGKLPSSITPAPPAPILALASKPGAILIQPDPNTVMLTQVPAGTNGGMNWALSYDEVVTLQGQRLAGSHQTKPVGTGYEGPAPGIAQFYPVSGGPPPTVAVVQALLDSYGAVLPTGTTMSNPAGGSWTATYSAQVSMLNPDGTVHNKTVTNVLPMTAFPSSGPQPSAGDTTQAVYADIMNNL